MTNENVRFFSSFLRGFLEGLCWKVGFSYLLSYLIDKKEYRKGKIIGRKDCRFKKQLYFCAVKMANKNVRFFTIFLLIHLYFLLTTIYSTQKQLKPYIKVTVFNHSPNLFTSSLKQRLSATYKTNILYSHRKKKWQKQLVS